ncbi:MAG: hypothetical protein IM319_08365 [Microcystis sp. M113S1]|jgi:hypothetical protein|nr:hypothetical protein [Microcystis sp. M113S1]MCA2939172.1 hypothetical protein [Microcystis sp. M113S1]MCU7245525.1 hypothetical protein [Microcystis aeruginosa WS75]
METFTDNIPSGFCLDQCLEIAVPWEGLHIEPDARLHLIAVLANQGQ